MAGVRKSLERIPDDKLAWKPHPRSASLGRIATHLAELAGFVSIVLESESLDVMPGGAAMPVREFHSREEILALFDQAVASARADIARASDSVWTAEWTLLANGRTIFTQPRLAVIQNSVIHHSIHHRAQLGVYLRLNDVAVPALYGPSADER